MRALILSILATLFYVGPASTAPKPTFLTETWKSIVIYEADQSGHCTAFSVRFDPPIYLSAAHCIQDTLGTIDKSKVRVVATTKELVAFQPEHGLPRPVLVLGSRPRPYEDVVFQFGFGGPFRIPFLYEGRALSDNVIPYEEANPSMMFSSNSVGGMSGGPIVNAKGELVSVILCGGHYTNHDADFGCGATFDELGDLYRRVTAR